MAHWYFEAKQAHMFTYLNPSVREKWWVRVNCSRQSGTNRVDLKKAGRIIGRKLERTSVESPQSPITILLDRDLKMNPVIWVAAGTPNAPNALFSPTSDELRGLTGANRIEIAEDEGEPGKDYPVGGIRTRFPTCFFFKKTSWALQISRKSYS